MNYILLYANVLFFYYTHISTPKRTVGDHVKFNMRKPPNGLEAAASPSLRRWNMSCESRLTNGQTYSDSGLGYRKEMQ